MLSHMRKFLLLLLLLLGQRPQRGRSPVEHRGTFVCPSVHVHPSVCSFVRPPQGPHRPEICPLRAEIYPLRPELGF